MFKLVREIRSRQGELHFKRWSLLWTPWFHICLHYIAMPDFDEHMHDHPWNFCSVILAGGYHEVFTDGRTTEWKRRLPFSMAYRKAEWFHKIEKLIAPTYTLVFMGMRRREWGYLRDGVWVDNDTYRKEKNDKCQT